MARAEPAADRIRGEMSRGDAGVSWINLGEAFYALAIEFDERWAGEVIEAAREELICELPDANLVLRSASIKASHRLSYADAFAVATAERHNAALLTGDPEIVALGRPGLGVVDLRQIEP